MVCLSFCEYPPNLFNQCCSIVSKEVVGNVESKAKLCVSLHHQVLGPAKQSLGEENVVESMESNLIVNSLKEG